MKNPLLFCAALLGFMAILIGAMADHALTLSDTQQHTLATAIRYHMLYAILSAALALTHANKLRRISCGLFLVGTIAFSGGIYVTLATGIQALGYLTPLGGVILMTAWLTLMLSALRAQ